MEKKRYAILLAALLLLPSLLVSQSYRSTVNGGNELYGAQKYDDAEVEYRKSTARDSTRIEGYFNLGNTMYRKGDHKAAMENFQKAMYRVKDQLQASQSLHNIGNSFLDAAEKAGREGAQLAEASGNLRQEGYQKAIEAYKQSLKLNPKDEDTRYNLAYAKKKLEELKRQNQKNDQNQKQDKKQDQQKKDKQQQDQQKNDKQDQQQKQQQQQQQDQQKGKESDAEKMRQRQEQQQRENMMNKQQAERILDALKNDEKDLQKKLKTRVRTRVQVDKDW